MRKLKKHDTVAIFEDPYTCKKLEGHATLLSKQECGEVGFERWNVCFEGDDDGMVVSRLINLNYA